ncbi:MAG: hypothetical protein ABSC42_08005 [Tepidisphaeraceae bacterium]|jgi:hypothetical protein
MIGEFAYSLNGEHYRGAYLTREEALAEAIDAARRCDDSPQMVYVARRVPADPMASGHARTVLANMSARARKQLGDADSSYLCGLSRQSVENLDKSLELAIRGWLENNGLTPTFCKVEAIGEYPVPSPSSERPNEDCREVHEIGVAAD